MPRNNQLELEEDFCKRNCPTCANQDAGSVVMDRLKNRTTNFNCKLPSGTVMTYEQRLAIISGIGHRPVPKDCPKHEEKETRTS